MTNDDFKIINEVLKEMDNEQKEELKSLLEVGIHWNVEVNDNSVLVSSDWSIHNTFLWLDEIEKIIVKPL